MTMFFGGLVAYGKNLGNYGQIFPVLEKDIRQILMNRLHEMESSGELEKYRQEVIGRVSKHIVRPSPLNLSTTNSPQTFYVDPTVTINQDIRLPNGVVVAKAGMRLNPFKHVTFSKTLFFFNSDDKHQLSWVKNHYRDYQYVKFILTGGDIREAANALGRVYFDLNGQLTQLLHIKHVPTIVFQQGLLWKAQEVEVDHA
ncbi:type-F conjugative transfer system protein TraW [Legionella septentrionalis]|uniref:type-F conjugative transfer system protein TraW n=1 Tax=Legionella septentrionalis TaxID=2498109 RepID=UPI001F17CAE1|nr:type-F conjugative transfer system protein TraW [Legionella septentrionalis]